MTVWLQQVQTPIMKLLIYLEPVPNFCLPKWDHCPSWLYHDKYCYLMKLIVCQGGKIWEHMTSGQSCQHWESARMVHGMGQSLQHNWHANKWCFQEWQLVTIGHHYADTLDCLVYFFPFPSSMPMYDMIWCCFRMQCNLVSFLCTIWSGVVLLYDTI